MSIVTKPQIVKNLKPQKAYTVVSTITLHMPHSAQTGTKSIYGQFVVC